MKLNAYVFAFVLITAGVSGQSNLRDTSFVSASVKNATLQYDHFIGSQQLYFNGSAYVEPSSTDDTHPFFETPEWQLGSIVFEGQAYNNVLLIYDAAGDKLIGETVNGNMIALNLEKVNSFKINNRQFIKIDNAQVKNSLPRSGFYEVLYNGKSQVIAMRKKERHEEIDMRELHIRFDVVNKYYVLKNGAYFSVKSKQSILRVFAEQKHSLKTLINKNNVSFRVDREEALASVAEFYDNLISPK